MKGLVVIHTEIDYLDPEEMGKDTVRSNTDLFDRISTEIGNFIKNGDKVYFLGCESKSLDSKWIYPKIKVYSSQLNFIPVIESQTKPYDRFCNQFLRTKKILMEHNLEKVVLSGVAHNECVTRLYKLLIAETPGVCDYYYDAKKIWGEKAERILKKKLKVKIGKKLTDC